MKYNEFIELAIKHKYAISSDDHLTGYLTITSHPPQIRGNAIRICRTSTELLEIRAPLMQGHMIEILEAAIELAKTPLEEREDEKRYIVPLPCLMTTDGEQQYLTHKNGKFFASRRDERLRQTWKRKDLQYLPEEYQKYAELLKED